MNTFFKVKVNFKVGSKKSKVYFIFIFEKKLYFTFALLLLNKPVCD